MKLEDLLACPEALERTIGAELKVRRATAKAAFDAASAELDRYAAAIRLLAGLSACYRPVVLFGCEERRFLFVGRYALDAGGAPADLECLLVPEAVKTQTWHRPAGPPDARGAVTMTPTPVPPDDVVATALALYAANVRIGAFSETLREPCSACGAPSLVCCEHGFDHDSQCQWLEIVRLCVRCPRAHRIAAAPVIESDVPHPLLPPRAARRGRG